jgi:hypothetical protein
MRSELHSRSIPGSSNLERKSEARAQRQATRPSRPAKSRSFHLLVRPQKYKGKSFAAALNEAVSGHMAMK